MACGYRYTDPKTGTIYNFTTSEEMLDFIHEQKTSKNGLHKLYKEHVEQLRLFKEERAKYNAMAK